MLLSGDEVSAPAALCGPRFSSLGLLWVLAMKMAVEEINNGSALLPGLHLGYDPFGTCSEPVVAMEPSLMFMARAGSCDVAAHCNYMQYQPRVLAVTGPHSPERALVPGKFFSFFLRPQVRPPPTPTGPARRSPASGAASRSLQVSYGAGTDRLSNREIFPSFFRTVPSDRVQAVVTVELLQELGWNWVAAVAVMRTAGRA